MFSQHFKHLYRRASESRHNQRLKKNTIMLKRDHSQWFIGVFHMIWITVLASSPPELFESFQVFESLLVFDIVWKWDILMGNENHVSAQLWWDDRRRGLVWVGRGLLVPLEGGDPEHHHSSSVACGKTLRALMLEVTSYGSINTLSQSVLGTVLLLV